MRHQGSDLVEPANLHYDVTVASCIAKLSWPDLMCISPALVFLSIKKKLTYIYLKFFFLLFFQDCTGNSLVSLGLHAFEWSACVGNLTASKSNQLRTAYFTGRELSWAFHLALAALSSIEEILEKLFLYSRGSCLTNFWDFISSQLFENCYGPGGKDSRQTSRGRSLLLLVHQAQVMLIAL